MIRDGFDVACLHMHSAFDELGIAHRLITDAASVRSRDFGWEECLSIGGRLGMVCRQVRTPLSKATILFQAGMEALLTHLESKDTRSINNGKFVPSWAGSLKNVGSTFDFEPYARFYRGLRNALAHPNTPERLRTIDRIGFPEVHAGIKAGWGAYSSLCDGIGMPHTPQSWNTMCKAHGVPCSIGTQTYPDLYLLRDTFLQKHLQGARGVGGLYSLEQ